MSRQLRQFIRHSMNVPIELHAANDELNGVATHTFNISAGGLSLHSQQAFGPGSLIHIRICIPTIEFEADAKVVWCIHPKDDFELGVTFLSTEDAFQVRMIEQMCYMEDYRIRVKNYEGRDLSLKDAATEWVSRYAASFPNP